MTMFYLLLEGAVATLGISVGAFIIGLFGGAILVLMRRSRLLILRLLSKLFIDIVRGLPPIVWLFLIFFGVGTSFIHLSPFQAATYGFGIISSAYLAEIYRTGFISLHKGQNEAAMVLGMSRLDNLLLIQAPQVYRVALPSMATYFVSLLKESAVASTLGVSDILLRASQESQATGGALQPFLWAALAYILLSAPVAWLARHIDHKLRQRVSK